MIRAQIIRQIVERDVSKLGLAAEHVQQEDAELYQAACDHFGTWDTALVYAGISRRSKSRRVESSGEKVLRQLHKLCVQGGSVAGHRVRKRRRQLYEAATYHFGSWRQALEAVGVNLEHEPLSAKVRHLDKQQILQDLREQHAAGLSLSWSVACLQNRSLATAARNAFHSWRKALLAAGLITEETSPNPYGKWSRDRTLKAIQRLHQEGRQLNSSSVLRESAPLMSAARRYFGSWNAALEAAGMPAFRSEHS